MESKEKDRPAFDEISITKIIDRAGDPNTAAAILFDVSKKNKLTGAARDNAEAWRVHMLARFEARVDNFNANHEPAAYVSIGDVLKGHARIGALDDQERIFLSGWQQRMAQHRSVEPEQPSKRFE